MHQSRHPASLMSSQFPGHDIFAIGFSAKMTDCVLKCNTLWPTNTCNTMAARSAAKSFIVYLYCLHAVDEMRIFNLF